MKAKPIEGTVVATGNVKVLEDGTRQSIQEYRRCRQRHMRVAAPTRDVKQEWILDRALIWLRDRSRNRDFQLLHLLHEYLASGAI